MLFWLSVRMGFVVVLQFCTAFLLFKEGFCSNGWESHRKNTWGSQKLPSLPRGGSTSHSSLSKLGSPLHFLAPGSSAVQFKSMPFLRTVAVVCNEADLLVTVQKDFFGTGHLVKEAELTLGSAGCVPTSMNATTITFQYGLHECGSTLKMTSDYFVYSTSLLYSPTTNLVIIRTNEAEVPIQCYYPRKDNVSSNAIQPTWIPYRSTLSSQQRMTFSLRLMNDDWSTPRASREFYLGDVLHIEASVSTDNHVPLRLFIDSCVATLQEDESSNPKYSIIDNYGCLGDSKLTDSSSAFKSPRPQDNTLQFDLLAFRFFKESKHEIYITCHVKAVSISQVPDSTNKACSFIKPGNFWSAIEGVSNICSCCDARNCGPATRSKLKPSGRRHWKRETLKGSQANVHLGPILISEDPVQEVKAYHPMERSMYSSAVEAMAFSILGVGILALCAAIIVYVKHKSLM
ncbi:zona pellucida sperm-binding protein 3-like [Protopterus annectens]|uniref:zona pellucida sperm-binding protein 3-like n=1 Tax=Protopterus annectens TaxID=7888 RepID=UPI001CF99B9F|nr:zona pellucida sperm-binding protein 3-like [Protopterus annectens]